MNWFTLLKQPELRTGSKVTTRLGSESKPEEDDCKRKLIDYKRKINNMEGKNMINFFTDDLFFPKLPEKVACKALKLLNGLQLKVFNSVGESGWFSYNYPMEETSVIIEQFGSPVVYYISGRYRYAPNLNTFKYNGHLDLLIERNDYVILSYGVDAKGTKEEVMRQVDWR